jgi:hypothetical protein
MVRFSDLSRPPDSYFDEIIEQESSSRIRLRIKD